MEYVVHQCAPYQYDLRRPYTDTITRSSKYLRVTKDISSIYKTIRDITRFKCYVDAEFV